jgi:putative hydrolase of the HAD superfamily
MPDNLLGSTALPVANGSIRERFGHVDTWVFDLDNTLYPAGSMIWPLIDGRITLYLATLLGLDGLSARALQKHYYQRYGTTLRGLMQEHAVEAGAFLDFVHDIDRTTLAADPDLAEALVRLPGRKLILTNGSRDHALRTTAQLGFSHVFEDVFDIVAAELVPKPEASVYDRFLEKHAVDPAHAAMFEDLARNLEIPHARGMRTVLVVPRGLDHREPWEAEGIEKAYVDVVIDDLAAFLRTFAPAPVVTVTPAP